jgi:hypothetical protein
MRFLALLGCLLPLALAGCGDSDHKSANVESGDTTGGAAGGDTANGAATMTSDGNSLADDVLLTLEGKHEILGGGARLNVQELRPLVLLTVTTIYPNNHDDLVLLQLGMNGVQNVMGQHSETLTSVVPDVNADAAENAVAAVQAYIGQVSYISQSGTLDVTLSSDGKIEGRVYAQLAPEVTAGSADSTATPVDISGYFSGKWSLICSSPVLNLPGDHSTPDSAYCKNLMF